MKNRLQIELRQKQIFLDNDPGQPVVIQCNPDGTSEYVPGSVPQGAFIDFTQYIEGLNKFKTNWSAVSDSQEGADSTTTNEIGSNYSKGLTAELRFEGPAFQFIFDWLMTYPCQIVNSIEARITDRQLMKTYRLFELKLDNTEYAPNDAKCIVAMVLREKDDTIHVFQKTTIEDNWQNWFNKDGTSTKDHPTFGIILQKKPGFFLAINMVLVYIAGMLSAGLLTAFTDGTRWIRRVLGVCYFCPSPLVRDYIKNICDKYGFTQNTIFDDLPTNPYRNVCLFYPVDRMESNFDNFTATSTKFEYNNRTGYPFAVFLNQLKRLYNAEWYVTPNNVLLFQHKSFFDNQPPIYDFINGAIRLNDLKYTFNGNKKPAYGQYQYQIDPQDTCSNEIKRRYNAIVDYDGNANNPMLEGHVTKQFDFAPTAFHRDGTEEDFIENNVKIARLIAVGAILIGFGSLFIAANPLTAAIVAALLALGYNVTNNYVNDFFDNAEINGMVRVASRQINTPRLLLWDSETAMNKAKVVYVENPAQNPYYNIDGLDYYTEHPAWEAPGGYFGSTVTRIYNYPMYVDEEFTENLFDRFHNYDNPLLNPVVNQEWNANVDLCDEMLTTFGVFENDFIKIGAVVPLEKRGARIISGRITDIDVDYEQGRINLKGNVLK
jgi:hypothetical protein